MPKTLHCKNLSEVRDNIDRIDSLIVTLLAERTRYVCEAAQFKTTRNDIRVPSRIEAIIKQVTSLAINENSDPQLIESVYRHLIEQSIVAEARHWDETHK